MKNIHSRVLGIGIACNYSLCLSEIVSISSFSGLFGICELQAAFWRFGAFALLCSKMNCSCLMCISSSKNSDAA